MTFASPRGLVALTLAWALLLYALEFALVPRTSPQPAGTPGSARIRLALRHLCCSGCSSDLVAAVAAAIPAGHHVVTPRLPTASQADANPVPGAGLGGSVVVDLQDVTTVDFARLDAEIRRAGLVPERLEVLLPEPAHLRLEASLPHLCCQQCVDGAGSHLAVVRSALRWLDSVQVDRSRKVVTAYAGYLAAGEPLDALEFLRALDDAGFHPEGLHVRRGD